MKTPQILFHSMFALTLLGFWLSIVRAADAQSSRDTRSESSVGEVPKSVSPDDSTYKPSFSTADPSDIRVAEETLRRAVDTPEAMRLIDEIETLETKAVELARQYRAIELTKPDGIVLPLENPKGELQSTLKKAFDLKGQLEEIRVKELRSRLDRLEGTLKRRESQRDKIIERRTRELLEGDDTNWNSSDSAPSGADVPLAAGLGSTAKSPADGESTATTRIQFMTADDVPPVTIEMGEFKGILPVVRPFERDSTKGKKYSMKLKSETGHVAHRDVRVDLVVFPDLEKGKGHVEKYLRQYHVPIEINGNELRHVARGRAISKIVYLPFLRTGELAIGHCESLVTVHPTSPKTRETPADRAVRKADLKRARTLGTVLVTVELYLDELDVDEAELDIKAGRNRQTLANSSTTKRSSDFYVPIESSGSPPKKAIDGTGDEVIEGGRINTGEMPVLSDSVTALAAARDERDEAQAELDLLKSQSDDTTGGRHYAERAKRRLASAQRRYNTLKDQYTLRFQNLKAQLVLTEREAEIANALFEQRNASFNVGAANVSLAELLEAKRGKIRAEMELVRLNGQIDQLHNVLGEFNSEGPKPESPAAAEPLSPDVPPTATDQGVSTPKPKKK